MPAMIPREIETSGPRPQRINGDLSINSQGGLSVLAADTVPAESDAFQRCSHDLEQAIRVAEEHRLDIVALSPLGIAVAGPAAAYEALTGGQIVTREILVYAEAATRRYVTHLDIVG